MVESIKKYHKKKNESKWNLAAHRSRAIWLITTLPMGCTEGCAPMTISPTNESHLPPRDSQNVHRRSYFSAVSHVALTVEVGSDMELSWFNSSWFDSLMNWLNTIIWETSINWFQQFDSIYLIDSLFGGLFHLSWCDLIDWVMGCLIDECIWFDLIWLIYWLSLFYFLEFNSWFIQRLLAEFECTPVKINVTPEKWWLEDLEDYLPIGKVSFQRLC